MVNKMIKKNFNTKSQYRNISISISVLYILLTVVVNYIPIPILGLLTMIFVGFLSSIFINISTSYEYKINRIWLLMLSLILVIILNFISTFLFESGYVFTVRKSLFNMQNRVVILYSFMSVYILEELLRYLSYIAKNKH